MQLSFRRQIVKDQHTRNIRMMIARKTPPGIATRRGYLWLGEKVEFRLKVAGMVPRDRFQSGGVDVHP
jgi:hypothetical protein